MIEYIVVHHTLTPKALPADQAEASFNRTHKRRNWGSRRRPIYAKPSSKASYIQYHYVIYGNGEQRQYRRDDEIGWHASNLRVNRHSIGIALSGNFDRENPSPAQIRALEGLLSQLVDKYGVRVENVVPHRAFSSKSCYGKLLPDDWARNLLTMSNVKIARYGKEWGYFVPATNPEAFLSQGLNYSRIIPTTSSGKVDWPRVKAEVIVIDGVDKPVDKAP